MLADPVSLLIVANSGRAMAQSAKRGGFSVTVVDGYGDRDTQAVAYCRTVSSTAGGLDPALLLAEIEQLGQPGPHHGLVYGAGFEHQPSTLSRLAERYRLLGNEPAVLELVADPLRFFALLDRLAIPHPAIRFQPPERADAAVWLVKQAGSSGGQGVRYWRIGDSPACAESYYQRYLEGLVASALFIADGSKHRLIGYNRLKAASADAGLPFLYGGAISHAPMTSLQKQQLEGIVGALVDNLGLCGVNSLDFILHEDEIYVLELNPRPTATLELYEDKFPDGAMRGHVVACLGQLPTLNPAGRGEAVRGHHIVYAEQSMLIDSLVRWPAWVKDRPSAGSQIAQGMPVCSLFAQGVTPDEVEYQFNRRLDELEKILSIYRVEH